MNNSSPDALHAHREAYTLFLADSCLILSQRNSEWCGHGPILEQDIALTNIALDTLGQARNFYQHAARLINQRNSNDAATEDSLAYMRNEREFRNLLLTELPNGDWAQTVLRQFLFSVYQQYLFEQLQHSQDAQLAAIAAKALKEVAYHVRWSGEWVIRLGDGTQESHNRMLQATETLWPYTGEMFIAAEDETTLAKEGIAANLSLVQQQWQQKVAAVFEEATLPLPEKVFMQSGGKQGVHTEHMGYILAEMQYLQRTYPGAEW